VEDGACSNCPAPARSCGGGGGLCSADGCGSGGGDGCRAGRDGSRVGGGGRCGDGDRRGQACSEDGPARGRIAAAERPGGDAVTGPPIRNVARPSTSCGGESSASESAWDHRRHDRIFGLFCDNRLQL